MLFALLGVNMLVTIFISAVFYAQHKRLLLAGIDAKLRSVATLVNDTLPQGYHDRITGPESVSDVEFQSIVERNNQLCVKLGLEYVWSLMVADGKIVFTTSTSPDKVTANRKHARFFELHSDPQLYTNTFATMQPTYMSSHDKWGDIRVALIPMLDAHGRKVLFGASVHLAEVNRQLHTVVWRALCLGLVVFVFSAAVGSWVAYRVTRPIRRLTDTIREIAGGAHLLQAPEGGSAEQISLARHFNQMNRSLQRRISTLETTRERMAGLHNAEIKQVADSLLMSEQRYRGLLDFAVDGVLIGTHDGVIIDANRRACELVGWGREALLGKRITEISFTEESLRNTPFLFENIHHGEVVVKERMICRADGSRVVVEMHSKMMPDGTLQAIFRDVTARKRSENELQEIGRMLDEAQQMVKLGGWEYDLETNRAMWTEEMYRLCGVGRDFDLNNLVLGLSFFDPESRPRIAEAFERLRERGEAFDLEAKFIRAPGDRIWVRVKGSAVLSNGKVVKVSGILMDISERKQAEAEIRRGQERLVRQYEIMNALLQNLSVGVFMAEAPSGRPLVTNRAARQLFGRDVLLDTNARNLEEVYETYVASDRTRRYPVSQMPVILGMQGVSAHVDDLVVRRPDGTEVILEVFGTPVKDKQGCVWASLVSFFDITERKRMEQALRDSEQRYRQLFEMESDAIVLVDNETGQILDVNLAAQKLYGYDRSELLALRNVDLSAEKEQTQMKTQQALETQPAFLRISSRKHRKRDGTIFPVEITASCFEINGRSVHIAAIRDFTERRAAQELLESWNALLERRVAERTAEVEKYAHQLQALTGRLVRAEEDERQRVTDVLHEDLQQILVAARMTLGVALQSAKVASVKKNLEAADNMLGQSIRLTRSLVQDIAVPAVREGELSFAMDWLRQQMAEKFNLVVEVETEGGVVPVSENVYLCLYRSVQELLFNVVKHANIRQVRVGVRNLDSSGGYVQVRVSDQGCGFAAGAVNQSGKTGKGFGLFSIRERLEGLGGRMEITSEAGRGTTIVLTAPSRG